MTVIQSIILGIVQGLTEFLPVSSSGHLNLFPWVLGWEEMPESFDVALHLGTLLAIIVYFYQDWMGLFRRSILSNNKEKAIIKWKNVLVYSPSNYSRSIGRFFTRRCY